MARVKYLVRQALLAALALLPLPTLAEVTAMFDPASGHIIMAGLSDEARDTLLAEPDLLRLQVATLDTARGMPMTLTRQDSSLVLTPRFALRPGTAYVLRHGTARFDIQAPKPNAVTPSLIRFAPSQSVLPANTLRLYLTFSEPMARGQLRAAARLERRDGTRVQSPFLNLEAELWDPSQTRATLLLDPGRIKQAVGPNLQNGAPLEPGQSYRLILQGDMASAAGVTLGSEVTVNFRVGPPERRVIDPQDWHILAPTAGGQAPITVAFDRIMDSGAAHRLLKLSDPQGRPVRGKINTDGGGWSLVPDRPWRPGTYNLMIDADLEDVSGNTTGAPFDASAGTIGTAHVALTRPIDIASR